MTTPDDFPDLDVLVASIANYLLQGDEREAVLTLLQCTAQLGYAKDYDPASPYIGGIHLYLMGPRKTYDTLTAGGNLVHAQLQQAVEAVLPGGYYFTGITVKAQLLDSLPPDWRSEALDRASGTSVSNQGVEIPNRDYVVWQRLRFRSRAEMLVAEKLDEAGVLFLPNCLARLGPKGAPGQNPGGARYTKEADFLVCADGKWGVLEVDGSQHEGAAARDHERDRLFRHHGIKVTERFTAKECFSDAKGVVRGFLELLARNG